VLTNKHARRVFLQDAFDGSGYPVPGYYPSSSATGSDTTTSSHGFGNGPAVTDAYVTNSAWSRDAQLAPLSIQPCADFTFPPRDVQQLADGLPPTPQTPSNATQTPYSGVFPGSNTAMSSFPEYTTLYVHTPLGEPAHHGLPCDSGWGPSTVPPETNQQEFQLVTAPSSSAVYAMENHLSSPNHQPRPHERIISFSNFHGLLSPGSFMEIPGVTGYQTDTTPVFLDEATGQTNHRILPWQHGRIIKSQSPSPPNPLSPPRSSFDTPTPKVEPPDDADGVLAAGPLISVQSGDIVRTPRVSAHEEASVPRPTGQPQTPRRRGPIAEGERKNISETRKRGACIRCHLQRTKVTCHLFWPLM
jgi:hypothetical protein